jgi:prepilin-type N-terminal cleavage/methylation domain-containing protein
MNRNRRKSRGFSLIELLACQPKALRRQARAAFTLIELLVVIAIIGVLFAVAMVVFENSGQKNTDRAAGQLVGIMRMARQHAVSSRQWTLVVFPNQDGGVYPGTDGETIDRCLRSVAVLGVVNTMDGLPRADQIPPNMDFAFVMDWKTLPDGIYFDEDVTLNGNFLFSEASTVFEYPMDPATPQVRVRPMSVVMFRPNGRSYVMHGGNPNGKYWQDTDHSKIYLVADKYYESSGGQLSPPTAIPGPRTVVEVRNKTGQVTILDP